MDRHRLGADFGTSSTVAVLADPTGQIRPLHFDGVELPPSAVCMGPDGTLLGGRDAVLTRYSRPHLLPADTSPTVELGRVITTLSPV